MNHKNLEQIKKWSIHLAFCAVFLYYFRNYCSLRPAAFPSFYKEFFSGVIALVVIYLNYLLLFPKLFACRKFKAFWLLTSCSIVMSGCLEMLLVFPEVKKMYLQTCDISKLPIYVILDTFNVTLRNGGWVLFFIAINEIQHLRRQEQNKKNVMRKKYGFVDVQNSDYSYGFISAENIYYCEQEQNIANIYAIDQKKYFRYCSMKRMEEILGTDDFVRISRDIIVAKKFIYKYSSGQLELRKIDNISETKTLWVGKKYENRLKEQLAPTIDGKAEQGFSTERKNPPKRKKEKVFIPKTKTILEEFNKNPKLMAVYLHIKKTPTAMSMISAQSVVCPKGVSSATSPF